MSVFDDGYCDAVEKGEFGDEVVSVCFEAHSGAFEEGLDPRAGADGWSLSEVAVQVYCLRGDDCGSSVGEFVEDFGVWECELDFNGMVVGGADFGDGVDEWGVGKGRVVEAFEAKRDVGGV